MLVTDARRAGASRRGVSHEWRHLLDLAAT